MVQDVPLTLIVFVGTFIEEIISPIPSFIVLVPTGAAAQAQGIGLLGIFLLAVVSAASRVLAAMILYWVGAKFEHVLFAKDRKIFGVDSKDIDRFSQQLSGEHNAFKVLLLLFVMHATPVFPGTFLSIGSGFIRLKYWIFLAATFFGSIVNALFYLGIGYMGLHAAEMINKLGIVGQVITVLIIAAVSYGLWRRSQKQSAKKTK